ncbi:MAG: hypothetical protein AB1700_19890, partial [Bacillota bacterium]
MVCATDFAHKINGAQVVDQGNTYSYPYSPAADTVCYSYACSRAGTYSILVQFQNTLGNLGPVQTINCVDHTPQCRVCSGPNCSQSISCGPGDIDVATAQLGFRLSEDVLNGSPAIYGSPDACQQLEFIAGGICHDLPAGGGVWWDRTYAPPAHSVTGFFSYQPPPGKRRDQEFTATASLNGSALSIVTYPNHGTYSLHIEMPNMGQPQLSCNQTNTCVASPGGGGGGGGGPGGGMPPPPQVQPQTPTTINAARSQGLFPLSGLISAFTNIIAPGGYTLSGNFPPPPSVVNLATAKICTQDESTSLWSCLSQAASSLSVGCASGSCNFSANIPHFSTWVVFADYPNSLPDLTAPALAGLQIGPDGQNWAAPGTVQNSSISFVRATVTDPSV